MPEESVIGVSIEELEPTPEETVETADPPKPEFGVQTAALEAALRISEEARQRAEAALRDTSRTASPPASRQAEPDAYEVMTDEQLQQLIDEKGVVAAMRAVQAQTFKLADRHLGVRLGSIEASGLTVAEQNARAKYATEFELFGDEITKLVAEAPDKSALSNPATWDNLIAWVRGKDGNIQKYASKLTESNRIAAEATARESQRNGAGVHPTAVAGPTSRSSLVPGDDGAYGLDATEREIADKLGRSYRDYAHWKKAGT